jgi:hypothetical protein
MRRTAAEIIGTYLCWDIRDVSDCRYQSTRYTAPAVYSIPLKGGIEYVCCPSGSQKPPRGFPSWNPIGEIHGRTIYGATSVERD